MPNDGYPNQIPQRIHGAPYGTRTRLFRLKSWSKFNDFNGHVDYSCNVPGVEDQMLSYESTWRPSVTKSVIGTCPSSCAGRSLLNGPEQASIYWKLGAAAAAYDQRPCEQ